jgi:cysteine desulfurase
MLYFDHNATTPLLPEARQAWLEVSDRFIGNPSSPHRVGARADMALQAARAKLAAFLDCDPMDIVWTSGATESNNMVLYHCARTAPPDARICISSIEHPCVLNAARHYFGGRCDFVPVRKDGVVDLEWLQAQLPKKPHLLAVMAANNETGVLQPWERIAELCREWEVPFFCDAAQWLGKFPARGLGQCDYVSGCAHKFGGPKGSGFLKIPRGRFHSMILGGQQEEGRRAGTENVAGVAAMLAALEVREKSLADDEQVQRRAWRDKFEEQLKRNLPVEVVGQSADRLWNTTSILMPEADCNARWVVKMDRQGCAVSTGSACASGKEEPSHVLSAMGYSTSEAGRMLRFSSGWETTEADWDELLQAAIKVASEVARVTA